MKKTLEDFSYNNDEWEILKIIEEDDPTTVFVDKKKRFKNKFMITGNIIGLTQVTSDSFLVLFDNDDDCCSCDSSDSETLGVIRYRFTDPSPIIEYNIDFSKYDFVNNDIIMFDESIFYSISNNGEVEMLNLWPKLGYSVSLVSKNKKSSCLLITGFLQNNIDYVVAAISDFKTFTLSSKAYSSLRDSYIKISDDLTELEDLIEEDNNYLYQINKFLGPIVDIRKLTQKK